MGGSILPVTFHNNKIMFLFGKERDIDENPGWSDFGGGTDKGESYIETASREGTEELTGFLGTSKEVHKMLSKYGTIKIDYNSEGHSTYRCHIFPMEYNEYLPHYYNNNQRFLQTKLDPKIIRDTKIFEKTEIKWWTFHEIKRNRNKFRSFYRNIIDLILQRKEEITKFIKSNCSKSSKYSVKNKQNTIYAKNKNTRKQRK
jgi:hypothetical protein